MRHPWDPVKRTERQRKQFDLYHALGSTVAMKYWVRSLVPVAKKTKLARIPLEDYIYACDRLAHELSRIETVLRDELRGMRIESKHGRRE